MTAYPALDDLEVLVRAGSGVAVIVEGESYEADPWLYSWWFSARARDVTFFPQDGWQQVINAVTELRRRCTVVPVYGIIDRDFADPAALDADLARLGILRTPRYTLENYLLDQTCWAAVFALVFSRQGHAPDGWDDPGRVGSYIGQAYRACLSLAAHNSVINLGCQSYSAAAALTPENQRTYLHHPGTVAGADPEEKLRVWGRRIGAQADLGTLYRRTLTCMEVETIAAWQVRVSGKYVLQELHRRFPRPPRGPQFDLGHYIVLYLDRCPEPPSDLVVLVDRIVSAAGR